MSGEGEGLSYLGRNTQLAGGPSTAQDPTALWARLEVGARASLEDKRGRKRVRRKKKEKF